MTERKLILYATLLGAIALGLVILAIKPYSRFEDEYPMTVASGEAAGVNDETGTDRPEDGENGSTGQPDDSIVNPAGSDGIGTRVDKPDAGTVDEIENETSLSVTGIPLVNPDGDTLEARVNTPSGFTRTEEEAGSLGTFLREFDLKPDGAPVLLYNREQKSTQNDHVAVFKLPLEKEDLQQCADSVMRVYAEYFRSTDQIDRIAFSLDDNFKAEYKRWREGYRIVESGDTYEWQDLAEFDDSKACFKKFMRIVFAYSGTYSLVTDSSKQKLKNIRIGDIFINAGSPGHVVMVVDMCENAQGRKAFLLAQGFMPAQQFHLLKNPAHAEDPWYYLDEVIYPFETPEYTFEKDCHRRPEY